MAVLSDPKSELYSDGFKFASLLVSKSCYLVVPFFVIEEWKEKNWNDCSLETVFIICFVCFYLLNSIKIKCLNGPWSIPIKLIFGCIGQVFLLVASVKSEPLYYLAFGMACLGFSSFDQYTLPQDRIILVHVLMGILYGLLFNYFGLLVCAIVNLIFTVISILITCIHQEPILDIGLANDVTEDRRELSLSDNGSFLEVLPRILLVIFAESYILIWPNILLSHTSPLASGLLFSLAFFVSFCLNVFVSKYVGKFMNQTKRDSFQIPDSYQIVIIPRNLKNNCNENDLTSTQLPKPLSNSNAIPTSDEDLKRSNYFSVDQNFNHPPNFYQHKNEGKPFRVNDNDSGLEVTEDIEKQNQHHKVNHFEEKFSSPFSNFYIRNFRIYFSLFIIVIFILFYLFVENGIAQHVFALASIQILLMEKKQFVFMARNKLPMIGTKLLSIIVIFLIIAATSFRSGLLILITMQVLYFVSTILETRYESKNAELVKIIDDEQSSNNVDGDEKSHSSFPEMKMSEVVIAEESGFEEESGTVEQDTFDMEDLTKKKNVVVRFGTPKRGPEIVHPVDSTEVVATLAISLEASGLLPDQVVDKLTPHQNDVFDFFLKTEETMLEEGESEKVTSRQTSLMFKQCKNETTNNDEEMPNPIGIDDLKLLNLFRQGSVDLCHSDDELDADFNDGKSEYSIESMTFSGSNVEFSVSGDKNRFVKKDSRSISMKNRFKEYSELSESQSKTNVDSEFSDEELMRIMGKPKSPPHDFARRRSTLVLELNDATVSLVFEGMEKESLKQAAQNALLLFSSPTESPHVENNDNSSEFFIEDSANNLCKPSISSSANKSSNTTRVLNSHPFTNAKSTNSIEKNSPDLSTTNSRTSKAEKNIDSLIDLENSFEQISPHDEEDFFLTDIVNTTQPNENSSQNITFQAEDRESDSDDNLDFIEQALSFEKEKDNKNDIDDDNDDFYFEENDDDNELNFFIETTHENDALVMDIETRESKNVSPVDEIEHDFMMTEIVTTEPIISKEEQVLPDIQEDFMMDEIIVPQPMNLLRRQSSVDVFDGAKDSDLDASESFLEMEGDFELELTDEQTERQKRITDVTNALVAELGVSTELLFQDSSSMIVRDDQPTFEMDTLPLMNNESLSLFKRQSSIDIFHDEDEKKDGDNDEEELDEIEIDLGGDTDATQEDFYDSDIKRMRLAKEFGSDSEVSIGENKRSRGFNISINDDFIDNGHHDFNFGVDEIIEPYGLPKNKKKKETSEYMDDDFDILMGEEPDIMSAPQKRQSNRNSGFKNKSSFKSPFSVDVDSESEEFYIDEKLEDSFFMENVERPQNEESRHVKANEQIEFEDNISNNSNSRDILMNDNNVEKGIYCNLDVESNNSYNNNKLKSKKNNSQNEIQYNHNANNINRPSSSTSHSISGHVGRLTLDSSIWEREQYQQQRSSLNDPLDFEKIDEVAPPKDPKLKSGTRLFRQTSIESFRSSVESVDMTDEEIEGYGRQSSIEYDSEHDVDPESPVAKKPLPKKNPDFIDLDLKALAAESIINQGFFMEEIEEENGHFL